MGLGWGSKEREDVCQNTNWQEMWRSTFMAGPAAPMSKNSAPVFCIAADVCVDEKRKKEEEEKKKHPHSNSKMVGGEKEKRKEQDR